MSVGLRIQPKSALNTIVATAVLHNILLKQNDTMPHNDLHINDELFEELDALPVQQVGNAVRNNIIENYFS